MHCPRCQSTAIRERSERTSQGYRRFRCLDCAKQFNERSRGVLNRAQYPSDVIALVVFWRLRYQLSLRDLAEMFLTRGIVFSYEAVRDWEAKLTPSLAEELRRSRKGKVGRSWYIDETYIRVQGTWKYLYRAIDRDGALVDVMLSERRDLAAAKRFFRSAKTVTGVIPDRVTTDGHDAYPQAIRTELGGRVRHRTNSHGVYLVKCYVIATSLAADPRLEPISVCGNDDRIYSHSVGHYTARTMIPRSRGHRAQEGGTHLLDTAFFGPVGPRSPPAGSGESVR